MIELLVVLIVLGLAAWAIQTYLPIPQPFMGIVMVVLALIALVLVLRAFGVATPSLR